VLTLPNLVTIVRLLLVPAVVATLAERAFGWALLGFLAAGFSDALDGYLARRLHQHSQVGALLDAVADKLIIFCTIVMLAWLGSLPMWVALLLVVRDVAMAVAVLLYRHLAGGVEIAPVFLGKLHVFVVFGMLALVLADAAGLASYPSLLPWLMGLSALTAVGSFLQYLRVWGAKLKAVRG
jgi:cardiolipin synthase